MKSKSSVEYVKIITKVGGESYAIYMLKSIYENYNSWSPLTKLPKDGIVVEVINID